MLYKINEIGDEGLSLKVPLSADWLTAECPDLGAKMTAEGLVFKGQLSRSGDDVFLNGSLSGGLECVCARCLEPARVTLRLPIRVMFVAREEDDDEEEDLKGKGDLDVMTFDGDEVNLTPELREQILLAVPISPLCREDCAGLCSVCGGNRNRTPCACVQPQVSSATRLGAALGKLKM